MNEGREQEPGSQKFQPVTFLPEAIRAIGSRLLHVVKDTVSTSYHVEHIIEQAETRQLDEAVELKSIEKKIGNESAVVFQNKTIVKILAVNLARQIKSGGEPLEDRILQLKHTLAELPAGTDLDSLDLPDEVAAILRNRL